MVDDNNKSVDDIMSPQTSRKAIGDLRQGVIELPLLEESIFSEHTPSSQGMRDHTFPAGLNIFSPMKGVCSNELLSVQGCRD